MGGPCTDQNRPPTFGDWFGLTMADDGRLWMGGLTNGGAIRYQEKLSDWIQSWWPVNPFWPSWEYPPIFQVPVEGDPVNIRGVAVTPDGVVWFASGEVESWRGPTYGLASWTEERNPPATRPPNGKVEYFDPVKLGALEYNILELQALADGRLVLGFPTTGLLVWTPGDVHGHRLTVLDGLPGEQIHRLSIDKMHSPPILFVPTDGGLAAFRQIP